MVKKNTLMDKIAGVVILYQPDNSVLGNIQTYASQVEKLFILDNSEVLNEIVANKIKLLSNAVYYHEGVNEGISKRLNFAAQMAIAGNFDLLLTMDQDSSFGEGVLEQYIACIKAYGRRDQVSMFGINYQGNTSTAEFCQATAVQQLITSGSVINLKNYLVTDGFDEALFIDEVDLDFCYNSITKGMVIIQFQNIYLIHQLGTSAIHRSFRSWAKTPRTLHSPKRLYYMVRNYLIVNKKYPYIFNEDKKRRRAALLNRLKNNLLYNKANFRVLYSIFKGIYDFKTGRVGKQ
jgi:rhamnosyltransferase